MKRIIKSRINKRFKRSKRYWSLKDGKISHSKPTNLGFSIFTTRYVSKYNSRTFMKRFGKPMTPYASWYKIFGYKNLDELYKIVGMGKYRER